MEADEFWAFRSKPLLGINNLLANSLNLKSITAASSEQILRIWLGKVILKSSLKIANPTHHRSPRTSIRISSSGTSVNNEALGRKMFLFRKSTNRKVLFSILLWIKIFISTFYARKVVAAKAHWNFLKQSEATSKLGYPANANMFANAIFSVRRSEEILETLINVELFATFITKRLSEIMSNNLRLVERASTEQIGLNPVEKPLFRACLGVISFS